MEEATDRIKNEYLTPRLPYLTDYHVRMGVGIPTAQTESPRLEFGLMESNPESGNQDEEFVEIVNPLSTSVDISGWSLSGAGIDFTFQPGTVLEAQGSVFVSLDVNTFRARAEGPSGNQSLFVQGEHQGHMSDSGGRLVLTDRNDEVVNEYSFAGTGVAAADAIRISEVHYHPPGPTSAEFAAGYSDGDDFEFIELINVSNQMIDLNGVQLAQSELDSNGQGVVFDFAGGTIRNLLAGQRILVFENSDAFRQRYGDQMPVVGQWSGGLSNASERITLVAGEENVLQFAYDDEWHLNTDGGGFSLEIIDTNNADLSSWRPSLNIGGSPGRDAGHGDLSADQVVDDLDIDLLQAAISAGLEEGRFDLTGDGVVDSMDLAHLVQNVIGTRAGDTDLDGDVDERDFTLLAADFGQSDVSWGAGDFDGNGTVDFSDFNLLTNNFGFVTDRV